MRRIAVIMGIAMLFVVMCCAVGKPSSVHAADDSGAYPLNQVGFINWMKDTKDLSKTQNADLSMALDVITKAEEESFLEWYGGDNVHFSEDRNDKITDLSDVNDAVVLRQMPTAIAIMKRINELRQQDENYAQLGMKDGYTNFYIMAIAATGAMRGAGLHRHSLLQVSCENLAWAGVNSADRWYYNEKSRFDSIKSTLGITTITSLDQIKAIEDYADDNNITIGHYTNLFWSADQVMGVGYTPYSNTACYNATKSSNYSGFRLYTIDEFEALMKEFCTYVGVHDFDEGTTIKKATCTEPGSATCKCLVCGYESEKVIPATGHAWDKNFTIDQEATCTAAGSKSKHCANCDEVKEVIEIPAKGHVFSEWEEVTPSACETAGLKQRTCEACGFTESEMTGPNGHDFEEDYTVDVPASCTADGSQSRHCRNCEAVIDSEVIPSQGHQYGDWTTTRKATCEDAGEKVKTCTACGDKIKETIPAKGHAYGAWERLNDDQHQRVCANDRNHVETADHVWDDGIMTKEATTEENGEMTFTCGTCGAIRTEVIPMKDIDPITPAEEAADHAAVDELIPVENTSKIKTVGNVMKKLMKVKFPTDSEVDNYRIQYRLAGKTKWNSGWSAGNNIYVIQGLKKSSLCEFRIAGYVKQADGSWMRGNWSKVSYRYMNAVPLKSAKAGQKGLTVTWRKDGASSGYQIQISLKKNMAGAKTITVNGKAKTKTTIKNLKSGKKYYVKVRPIKKKSGKTYLGILSKAKADKVR